MMLHFQVVCGGGDFVRRFSTQLPTTESKDLTNISKSVTIITRNECYIMTKVAHPTLKGDLLKQATSYALKNGLQDLSLRPLAKSLDTSARMLVYHFGSKEQLMVEILECAMTQQRTAFQEWANAQTSKNFLKLLEGFWQRITAPELRPFMRLLFEVDVLGFSGHLVYQRFAKETSLQWIGFMETLIAQTWNQKANQNLGTTIVATLNGLLLDLLTTGEEARVEKAFRTYLNTLKKG
jgi:AcrR family transcriptional regulator